MVTDKTPEWLVKLWPALVQSLIVGVLSVVGTVQWLASDMRLMVQKMTIMEQQFGKVVADVYEARRIQMEIVPMRNLQVKTLQDDVAEIKGRLSRLEQRR